ncbi:MAG: hypothetical protein AAB074_01625 [Planctomycetota bacterium]
MRDFLDRLARRARVVAAREAFLDAFFWTSYGAASVLVADRIRLEFSPGGRPLSTASGAFVALGAALVVSAAAALIRAVTTRPAATDLARAADRSLGLHDSVATALEDAPGALAPLLRRQAEADLSAAAPGRVLPAPVAGRRRWALAAVIAALLVALFPLPDPRREEAASPVRARRPRSGATIGERELAGGGSGGGRSGTANPADGEETGPGALPGRGRPAPPPPLFGDPERKKLRERPEHVDPLVGEGAWKPSSGLGLDAGAAAGGAPEAATDPERLAAYRRQAEAFTGRDGFPEADREIVRGYFERVVPAK